MMKHATKDPWVTTVRGPSYGGDRSYLLAAEWLKTCDTVADWGGAQGYFERFLPADIHYMLVDGTKQVADDRFVRLVDLAKYRGKSEGILLRHVLEMDSNWRAILQNAVAAFTHRLAVVTFTPDVAETHRHEWHLTWPCHFFNHQRDLLPLMQPYLVKILDIPGVKKKYPERLYCLEKV